MCFPGALPLAGVAASGAGAYMGQQAENKQARAGVKARNKATEAEIARQRGFEAQGVAERDKALSAVTTPSMPIAALQARREAAMKAAVGGGGEYNPAPGSAPQIVQNEITRKGADAATAAGKSAARTGRLSAYGDLQSGTNLALTDSSRRLKSIGDASYGSASLLPADVASKTYNTTRKGDGLTLADMLGLAGQGAVLAGGLGVGDDLFTTAMPKRAGPMGRANPMQVG